MGRPAAPSDTGGGPAAGGGKLAPGVRLVYNMWCRAGPPVSAA